MSAALRFVYILRSESTGAYYTGLTCDPYARLAAHNAGRSPHTSKTRPWRLDVVIEFADEARATAFRALPQVRLGRGLCAAHVVLFELIKGWATGETPELGKVHRIEP